MAGDARPGIGPEALEIRRRRLVVPQPGGDVVQGRDLAAAALPGSGFEQTVEGRVVVNDAAVGRRDQEPVASGFNRRRQYPGPPRSAP